jgi:hypothetical protein
MKTLREQLHEITLKQDQRVVSLDLGTVRAQTFDFYEGVVTPAFETLNREFGGVNDSVVITLVQGWIVVRVYHEARQHNIRYAVQTCRHGMQIRVRSQMTITDHQGTHSTKAQILFGCKHKALADISQDDIVRGFLDLYARILPSEE